MKQVLAGSREDLATNEMLLLLIGTFVIFQWTVESFVRISERISYTELCSAC